MAACTVALDMLRVLWVLFDYFRHLHLLGSHPLTSSKFHFLTLHSLLANWLHIRLPTSRQRL